jgi:hypothetical protein
MPKRIVGINMHYLNIKKDEQYKNIIETIEEIEMKYKIVKENPEKPETQSPETETVEKPETPETPNIKIENDPSKWKCNMLVMEQFHYVDSIIRDITKEKQIPLPSTVNLNQFEKGDGKVNLYEEMGLFRYLNDHTRPDFMTATTMMSSYMINPSEKHLKLTRQMKQYLNYSKRDFKVIRKMENDKDNMTLFAYCDGSYLQDYDCKSYIGFNFFMDTTSSSIFDKCVKDSTVSRSSTIVEIKAIDLCVLYALTLRMLLTELGFPQKGPTVILTDSQPSLDIFKNEQINDKVLYINVRIHFIREHQLMKEVIACKVGTFTNVADSMTKCLAKEGFDKHKAIILYGHQLFDEEKNYTLGLITASGNTGNRKPETGNLGKR